MLTFLLQIYDKKGTLAKKNAPAGNGGGAKSARTMLKCKSNELQLT